MRTPSDDSAAPAPTSVPLSLALEAVLRASVPGEARASLLDALTARAQLADASDTAAAPDADGGQRRQSA